MTQEQEDWWNTLDMNDTYLSKMRFSMFGTAEKRAEQLWIIKDNINFKKYKI